MWPGVTLLSWGVIIFGPLYGTSAVSGARYSINLLLNALY